jgi:hypothetical protein
MQAVALVALFVTGNVAIVAALVTVARVATPVITLPDGRAEACGGAWGARPPGRSIG